MSRLIGYAIIAGTWAGLLGLTALFGLSYVLYRDLRWPETSRLVYGTRFEALAKNVFEMNFWPIWHQDPACAQFDPQLIYVPRPGVARYRGTEFDTIITMTSEGLRQQPGLAEARKAGPIVMVGDSFTMGWGVNDTETFSAILESRFRHPTINSGVGSYGTARELRRLQRLGLLAPAKMLVIQFCTNDAPENLDFLVFKQLGLETTAEHARERFDQIQAPHGRTSPDVTYGRVLRGVIAAARDGRFFERREENFYVPRYPRMAEDFLGVIDQFPELAGKPILVIQLKDPDVKSNFLPQLEQATQNRPNIRVLRLQLEPADFLRFDAHLNVRGNEKVAEQLDRAIRDWR